MIYIENNLEKQDLFIPRNDGQTCYVSPYDKGYQDGYEDGLEDCGSGCTLQEKEVTVTATTQVVRPDSGYVGMDVVSINASQFVLEKYNEGYHDGEDAGEQTQKDKLASTAFTENGVYRREDGWNEVEVDVDIPELGPDVVSLNAGWGGDSTFYPAAIHKDGFSEFRVYDNGYGRKRYNDGVNDQKALLSSTAFTQNDTYTNQDGWSAVTVNVPTGTSCNLEAKNETITAATQTILPSSGYDGMNSVAVDATSFGNDKYAEGFADGQASCPPCPEPEIESGVTYELQSGFTGTTITPASGYDGMADVTITDNGYGQEKYDEGYGDGFVSGQTDILSGMSSTAFTVNDTYTNPSGWSAVTVNVPTGSSCNLEGASYSIPSGFTGTTLTPSSGYDGMSAVTITDGGYGQEKYDEGYADGQSSSCNMQAKNVTLTATTECIYPDAGSYEYYLGFNSPDWAINNLIDTGIHPTQTSTLRYKYKGRGCASDRIMGTIDGYQGCTDSTDYRFFDIIGLTLDIGDIRYSTGGWADRETVDGTDYDITLGNSYVYDNINSTYIFNESTNTVETAYTYTVDVGSVWCKEVVVEDNGVTLFHGTPSEVNGVVGLYDSVSQTLFTLYSGSTGTTVLDTIASGGYDGMSAITVNASALCQSYYDNGYADGEASCTGSSCTLEAASYAVPSGFTGTTLSPSSGYDGMSAVTITDGGYGQEKYDEGYADGQASCTGGTCNMEDKSVVLTADTQTILPSGNPPETPNNETIYGGNIEDFQSAITDNGQIWLKVWDDLFHTDKTDIGYFQTNNGDYGFYNYQTDEFFMFTDCMETWTQVASISGMSIYCFYDSYNAWFYESGFGWQHDLLATDQYDNEISFNSLIFGNTVFDCMSSVDIDASGLVGDAYNEGWEDGYQDGRDTFALQIKSVGLTATTETFYPDSAGSMSWGYIVDGFDHTLPISKVRFHMENVPSSATSAVNMSYLGHFSELSGIDLDGVTVSQEDEAEYGYPSYHSFNLSSSGVYTDDFIHSGYPATSLSISGLTEVANDVYELTFSTPVYWAGVYLPSGAIYGQGNLVEVYYETQFDYDGIKQITVDGTPLIQSAYEEGVQTAMNSLILENDSPYVIAYYYTPSYQNCLITGIYSVGSTYLEGCMAFSEMSVNGGPWEPVTVWRFLNQGWNQIRFKVSNTSLPAAFSHTFTNSPSSGYVDAIKIVSLPSSITVVRDNHTFASNTSLRILSTSTTQMDGDSLYGTTNLNVIYEHYSGSGVILQGNSMSATGVLFIPAGASSNYASILTGWTHIELF